MRRIALALVALTSATAAAAPCDTAVLDRMLQSGAPPEAVLAALAEACPMPPALKGAARRLSTGWATLTALGGSAMQMLHLVAFWTSVCPDATQKVLDVLRSTPQERAAGELLHRCGLDRFAAGAANVPIVRVLVGLAVYGWMTPDDPQRAAAVLEHLLQPPRKPVERVLPPFRRAEPLRRIVGGPIFPPAAAGQSAAAGIHLLPQDPPPRRLEGADPTYLETARRAEISGTVALRVKIGVDGRVAEVRLLKSLPILGEHCATVVRGWRFEPQVRDGKPVPVSWILRFRFAL